MAGAAPPVTLSPNFNPASKRRSRAFTQAHANVPDHVIAANPTDDWIISHCQIPSVSQSKLGANGSSPIPSSSSFFKKEICK